ncbi:MAG: replicative DNA helicase [Verrucomicrobiota bacterium JB022]|nr:replicative DNA helicase [Verrucomicrobiota bacterium JB022]
MSSEPPQNGRTATQQSSQAVATDRHPPHNLDAEEGLLAACLLDGGQDVLTLCMEARLRHDAFYKPAHQVLFHVMMDLYAKNVMADEVVVIDHLASHNIGSVRWLKEKQRLTPATTTLLDLIGGPSTILEITNRVETTTHARYWLQIVRDKWILRRLIDTSRNIVEQAYSSQGELNHFIDTVEQQILAINEDRIQDSAQKFEVAVDQAANLINMMLQGRNESGVLTQYRDLDDRTFGLHPGQMIVLAARPSMGKTSFALNIAENVALPPGGKDGHGVLVFSLEMPSEQLAMRMLCGRAKVNLKKVRDRMISKDQVRELTRVGGELKRAPIWVDDSSGLNILELRAKARRMSQQHPIRLIVIDYLQLISGIDSRVPREQQISEISRGVKALAKELNVPVLVLSQLNRASEKENRMPRISDLRESGSIEQDADMVFLLDSPRSNDKNPASPVIPQAAHERLLIIAKQRNGPTGDFKLTFIPDFTRFENYTSQSSE